MPTRWGGPCTSSCRTRLAGQGRATSPRGRSRSRTEAASSRCRGRRAVAPHGPSRLDGRGDRHRRSRRYCTPRRCARAALGQWVTPWWEHRVEGSTTVIGARRRMLHPLARFGLWAPSPSWTAIFLRSTTWPPSSTRGTATSFRRLASPSLACRRRSCGPPARRRSESSAGTACCQSARPWSPVPVTSLYRAIVHVAAINLRHKAAIDSVSAAVESAVRVAEHNLESLAFPLLGAGNGNLDPVEALAAMRRPLEDAAAHPPHCRIVRYLASSADASPRTRRT